MFGIRFVDDLKKSDNGVLFKSCLETRNYGHDDAPGVATKAATVQLSSQRVMFALYASFPTMRPFIREIAQAYTQYTTPLERDVFIIPPVEMVLRSDSVLKVMRPIYGIPESGLHWYLTYLEHHLLILWMNRSVVDPFVLHRRSDEGIDGQIIQQVDDSYGFGTEDFLKLEYIAANNFNHQPRMHLSHVPVRFNGLQARQINPSEIFKGQN